MEDCKPLNFTGPNCSNACHYVLYSNHCSLNNGFLNYYSWQYCAFNNRGVPSFLMICWLLVLLLAIAVTADSFFAPCLVVVTKVFRMSQNLAGVTLLALGNGAPDIFSALSAVDSDNVSMALGSIFGAGILVNTITAGIIMIVCPFFVTRRPVMKDLVFYLLGVIWCVIIIVRRKIELWSALILLCLYILYVFVTVVSRLIHQKYKSKVEPNTLTTNSENNLKTEINDYVNHFNNVLNLSKKNVEEILSCNLEEIDSSILDENNVITLRTMRFKALNSDIINETSCIKGSILSFQSSGRKIILQKLRSTSHRESGMLANLVMANEVELHSIKKESVIENVEAENEGDHYITRNKNARNIQSSSSVINEVPPKISKLNDLSMTNNDIEGYYVEFPGIIKHFFLTISPLDIETWSEQTTFERIQNVIQSPVVFLLTLTIPVVNDGSFMRGWCKILNVLHCIVSPLIWIVFFDVSLTPLGSSHFLLIYLILIIGILLCILVCVTSKADKPPIYHTLYAFVGFITSIVWIYVIANEIVNLLTVFGVVFSIPSTILGLSVLAFANSIGDLVSNIVLAKKGFPGIGYAACIGGPLFNLLVGIGLPFTKRTAEISKIEVVVKAETVLLIFTALLVTVLNLVALPLQKFKLRSIYGIILIILYIIFFVLVILFSTQTIMIQI